MPAAAFGAWLCCGNAACNGSGYGDMLWVCKYFKPVIDDDGNFRNAVEPDEERNPRISEMVSSCFLHIADGTAIYAG